MHSQQNVKKFLYVYMSKIDVQRMAEIELPTFLRECAYDVDLMSDN